MSETKKFINIDDQRFVGKFDKVWIAEQEGMAAIGATRKDALARLKDCIKCKTSLQIIHTWAKFQGGRELVPKHVENLTTKTLAPFRRINVQGESRRGKAEIQEGTLSPSIPPSC